MGGGDAAGAVRVLQGFIAGLGGDDKVWLVWVDARYLEVTSVCTCLD